MGLNIAFYNPLRSEFIGITYKDKFKVKGIQFYLLRKKIVIRGLEVLQNTTSKSETDTQKQKKEWSKTNLINKNISNWLQTRFTWLASLINDFNIVFTKIDIPNENLIITDFVIETFMSNKSNEIGVKSFIRDIIWYNTSIHSDSLFTIKAILNFDKMYDNKFPFENIDIDFKIGKILVPMDIVKNFNSSRKSNKSKKVTDKTVPSESTLLEDTETTLQKIIKKMNDISHSSKLVDQVNITVDEFLVKNLPITFHPKLLQMNKYLNYDVYVSNFTLDVRRFTKEMPGFKLYFNESDTPFKYTTTLSRLNVCLNIIKKNQQPQVVKVFELPSLALFGESNMLSQRFLFNKVETIENAVFNVKGNISSPTLDIDVRNISFVKSFIENITVFTQSFGDPVELTCGGKLTFTRRRDIFTSFFKSVLPLLNVKLTLEDTKLAITDDTNLILLRVSSLILNIKSQRNIVSTIEKKERIYFQTIKSLELLDFSIRHKIKNDNYTNKIFNIGSATLQERNQMEPFESLSVSGTLETLEIDLSELPTMVMLNMLLRKLDCQVIMVEEHYFKPLYEKYAAMIKNSEKKCFSIGKTLDIKNINPRDFLFLALPKYFDFVKIDVRNFKISLGARSVFMPPDIFSSTDPQSSHDLVDGKLRKLLIEMDELQIALCGNQTQWKNKIESGRVTMVRSGDISDYKSYGSDDIDNISTSESTDVTYPWNLNVLVNSIVSTVIGETAEENNELTRRTVSKLSIFSMKIYPETEGFSMSDEPKLVINVSNKKLKTLFCLNAIFLAISGIHTLHQIFGAHTGQKNRESLAKKYFVTIGKSKRKSHFKCVNWSELKNIVVFNLSIDELHQLYLLPNGLKARIDAVNTFLTIQNLSNINLSGEYFRVCIQSPVEPNLWERLVIINKYKVTTDVQNLKNQMKSDFVPIDGTIPGITLENESWHFTVPHKFAIYKLIDNFSTTFKFIKQLLYSFRTSKNDIIIFPHPVKTPSLPMIKLLSNRYILSIADDPFEAQMNVIFQIGLEEQKLRIAKWKEFDSSMDEKVTRSKGIKISDSVSEIINKSKITKRNRFSESSSQKSTGSYSNILNMISDTMEATYEKLQKNISTSWIRRVQNYKSKEREEFNKNFSFLWGNIDFSSLPTNIGKNVNDFTKYPFLSNLIMENVDVDLFRPSVGVQNVPQFIYRMGKKVPIDTKYSIMIPMHIDAKFSEIRWHLRDYPLPFVYVPTLENTQTKEPCSLRIHGDFIVAEDMIQSDQELRTVFVPLVPSIIVEDTDRYYSLLVPRTITSLKFFTDLHFDVYSKDTSMITFGGSYQPAIQHMMQCIENISKPPLDPSKKTGFWDKVRYLFHGSLKISWKNSGRFEINLKGSKSPYILGGNSAGYSLGFDNNVELRCNEDEDPRKFLSCSSDKLYFFMPNFFARPLLVWSRSSDDTVFIPSQENSNLQGYASYYYLLCLDNTKSERTDIIKMNDSFMEKIAIKLTGGVEFNLGLAFERSLANGSIERSISFIDHHKVRLCNPIYVKDCGTHDSYAGFRSDFIHMSFELLSKKKSAYNAMQLTPNALDSFFRWWKTFSGNFPVRRGKLFDIQSISPKFSEHLYTISYLADISPLFISYICHNIDYDKDPKKSFLNTVEYGGIKARNDNFLLDLHQRKEVLTEYNQKLDIRKRVKKLKFHMGDLRLSGIDIRTINTTLKRIEYVEQRENTKFNIFDNDMSWFDLTDYREAYFINPFYYVPEVNVTPLLYSPKFIYKKRASYGDRFQIDSESLKPIKPLVNSLSHRCIIPDPITPSTETLHSRSKSIKIFQNKIKQKMKSQSDPKMLEELNQLDEQAEEVGKMLELLTLDLTSIYSGIDKQQLGKKNYNIQGIQSLENSILSSDIISYENMYAVHNMLLKVNKTVRDDLFKFKHYFGISNSFLSLSSKKTLKKFEEIVSHKLSSEWKPGMQQKNLSTDKVSSEHNFESSQDERNAVDAILDLFNYSMSSISTSMDYIVHKNHCVHFIIPQIQITCEQEAESCIIVTSPNIMTKSLSFEEKEFDSSYSEDIFLNRTGILLNNANVFLFNRKDYKDQFELHFDTNSYGQKKGAEWPPWLGIEHAFGAKNLKEESLVKNLYILYKSQDVLPFSNVYELVKRNFEDKTTILVPKVNVSLTSPNYGMIMGILKRLVLFTETNENDLNKKIEKVALGYDIDDMSNLYRLISALCENEQKLKKIQNELNFKREILDDVENVDLSNIYAERMNHLLKLHMLLKVLESNNTWKTSDEDRIQSFNVKVNEVIIHLLNEDKSPFIDMALARAQYSKNTIPSGFYTSRVKIDMLQAFNLEEALYNNLIGPYLSTGCDSCPLTQNKKAKDTEKKKKAPLVDILWEMEKPVGGIKIINAVKTNLRGISLKLEDDTIKKIINWLSTKKEIEKTYEKTGTVVNHNDTSSMSNESNITSDIDIDDDVSELINPNNATDAIKEEFAIFTKKNEDLNEMLMRSSHYMIVDDLLLNSFKLCVSYKGKGTRRLIDVSDFLFTFPELKIKNQVLRFADILKILKRVLIRVLMNHTGKFLSTKLKRRSTKDLKLEAGQSLKPLTVYKSYTTVEELKE